MDIKYEIYKNQRKTIDLLKQMEEEENYLKYFLLGAGMGVVYVLLLVCLNKLF
jgi:hypothetical protein